MKKVFYIAAILAVIISSCKKKDDDETTNESTSVAMEVELIPQLDGAPYNMLDVIESPQGYKYFYTDIKIVGTDVGNGTIDFDADYYFNYSATNTSFSLGIGDPSLFKNLSFNVGVPSDLNHADPSLPSNNSALNITNVGDMHWGWNPGYKFVVIEGKVDTTADGIDNFDKSFFFHLGTDFLFRTKTFTDVAWTKVNDTKYRTGLTLDVKAILDGTEPTDLRVNATSHSENNQMAYSLIIMNQFMEAIKKQ